MSFRQVSIWHPTSISHLPLFSYEVRGGFWEMQHCHTWRYVEGIHHSNNHNHPCNSSGESLARAMVDMSGIRPSPVFIHMACASDIKYRRAKNQYYVARGEGTTDHRGWYVKSREAAETWKPGDVLPNGAGVRRYEGPIPEVFLASSNQYGR